VNSRYALESRRSKDVDFNKLKGRYRPEAALQLFLENPSLVFTLTPILTPIFGIQLSSKYGAVHATRFDWQSDLNLLYLHLMVLC
jgi:hypothetical protein